MRRSAEYGELCVQQGLGNQYLTDSGTEGETRDTGMSRFVTISLQRLFYWDFMGILIGALLNQIVSSNTIY